ncbi:MAG: hypothetical protein ABH983_02720 [Candidatus Micrarchaeota archaeon]|nr:hypothetical protein [Candidatus Micrarchaeota archaeon]
MNKFLILLSIIGLFGCLGVGLISVEDLDESPEDYLGEKVSVRGTVEDTFKLGKLSGFKLTDGNHSILVSSEELPKEGDEAVVSGTVMKEAFVGYYILAKEIN